MRKYASLEVLESWRVPQQAGPARLRKAAHRVAFDYDPRPGYLYVRSRMISSRTNDNHDTFPAGEIEKGYRTFLGKPVFVNHHNANHRRARGVIVAIALHRDRNPDGTPDTWVEGLMEIDALRFPKLAKAILAGKVNRTSMGVDVEWSHCSACGNKATSPAEYCKHLPALKGKKIRKRNPSTGKIEEKLIHEVCAGLSFFENSLLVEDPADPTAYLLGKPDDRGLSAAASKHSAATFTRVAPRCINCGKDFNDGKPGRNIGDWRNGKMPYLCNDCAYGHTDEESFGKPPSLDITDKGGMGSRQNTDRLIHGIGEHDLARKWTPDDETLHSLSRRQAAKRAGGDHPFFKENPVSSANVVAAYHDSTQDEKALGDRWYSDAHHVAKSITGGDAAKGAGLLSAYSPQTAWPVNMFNASRAAQGDPPGPGSGAMGIHQKSAMRILGGEHHSQVLKAPKTAAFAHLIEHGGDTAENEKNGTEKVVVDRHALSVAVGRRLGKEEGSKAPLGQGQHYEHVAQAYREAAHILSKATGRKISPHQVQAATWLRQIRKNQEEDTSGKGGGGLGAGKGRVQMQNNSKTRWEQHHKHYHPTPHHIPEENMHYHGLRRAQAYGETRVPPDVDTLRMEECPVCGEHDVWSGSRCPVCGFIVPPSLFRDPDTSKAQQVRDELDQSGEVVTQPGAPGDPSTQQVGSGQDADDQLTHPDQVAPDGTPGVQEGGPLPPMAQDGTQDEAAGEMPPDGQEEEAEGAAEEEQGEEDQEQGAEEESEGQELEQQGEEDELAPQPDLMCPACGAAFSTDMAAQPGTPCPACRQGSLQPAGGPPEGTEDPDAEDEDEGEEMAGSKTAAALARAQAHRIAVLTAENEVLTEQLRFLGSAAGVEQHLAAIRQNVLRKHADVLNPASPVPDPPEAPPTETTEQALAPEIMDDPSRPGTTPGANTHVPAAQTTTAITPGVEMQTPPATNLIDVTAPVTGTNPSQDGGVPLEQRRIETDVRIDPDPLKAHGPGIGGQGDNGSAFPWILDAQPGSQAKQGQGQRAASLNGGSPLDPPAEADTARRTFASIRLARLRIATGSAQGDELAVAERIEKDASLPTAVIEHEIGVLGRIQQTAAVPVQRPVQRQAARQAPSLASVGASMGYAPASMAADDDGSDIFL